VSRLLRPDEVEEGIVHLLHEGEAGGRERVEVLLTQESHGVILEAHELAAEAAAVALFVEDRLADAERGALRREREDAAGAVARAAGASRRSILTNLHIESSFLLGAAEALPRS